MFQRSNRRTDSTSPVSINGFSEREAVALFQAGRLRKMTQGEPLVRQGESLASLVLVIEGELSVMMHTDSTERVMAKLGKGSWLGNPDAAKKGGSLFLVAPSQTARVLEIDQLAFSLLNPEIQLKAFRSIVDTTAMLLEQSFGRSGGSSRKTASLSNYAKRRYDDGNDQYAGSVIIQDMIHSFPRLPIQINKLTSMLLDEGVSVSEIVGFAKMDPSIVSVVLKTVNSGYYSFQRKISDFHHAFVLLGFNQVYQILMENFLEGFMPKHFNLKAFLIM